MRITNLSSRALKILSLTTPPSSSGRSAGFCFAGDGVRMRHSVGRRLFRCAAFLSLSPFCPSVSALNGHAQPRVDTSRASETEQNLKGDDGASGILDLILLRLLTRSRGRQNQ
uniref:Uncharacterized protein n=1 Tax=Sphaerodactylus townsendi TaxID=933632 RepID=A0ACB8EN90_9SAUR